MLEGCNKPLAHLWILWMNWYDNIPLDALRLLPIIIPLTGCNGMLNPINILLSSHWSTSYLDSGMFSNGMYSFGIQRIKLIVKKSSRNSRTQHPIWGGGGAAWSSEYPFSLPPNLFHLGDSIHFTYTEWLPMSHSISQKNAIKNIIYFCFFIHSIFHKWNEMQNSVSSHQIYTNASRDGLMRRLFKGLKDNYLNKKWWGIYIQNGGGERNLMILKNKKWK